MALDLQQRPAHHGHRRGHTCTEPPPTKVERISGLERLRRTVGPFPTEVGGFKPDLWKMKLKIAA